MLYNSPTGGAANDSYVGKNVAAGLQGSKVPPAAVEYPQRELVALITAAGLAPTNSDLEQTLRAVRSGVLEYYIDAGAVNAPAIKPSPAHTALVDGLHVRVRMKAAPTGVGVLNLNALQAPIQRVGGVALAGGEWGAGDIVDLVYNAPRAAFQIDGLTKNDVAAPSQITYGPTSKGGLAKDASNNFLLAIIDNLTADNRAQPVGADLMPLGRAADDMMVSVSVAALAAYVLSFVKTTNTFRQKLSGNLTVYIRSDGNDANNGLANTPAGAFQTIQGARNAIFPLYDAAGFTITLQLAHASGETVSTFGTCTFSGFSGSVVLQGDINNPGNFIINCGPSSTNALVLGCSIQSLTVVGVTFDYTYNGAATTEATVTCTGGGILYLNGCVFNCSNNRANLIEAYAAGGQITFGNLTTTTMTGAGVRGYFAVALGGGSAISAGNAPVNVYFRTIGTLTYTSAFARAIYLASQNYNQADFSGVSVTATKKFDISGLGNIAMAGNPNFLPGTIAGTCSNNLNGYS